MSVGIAWTAAGTQADLGWPEPSDCMRLYQAPEAHRTVCRARLPRAPATATTTTGAAFSLRRQVALDHELV